MIITINSKTSIQRKDQDVDRAEHCLISFEILEPWD